MMDFWIKELDLDIPYTYEELAKELGYETNGYKIYFHDSTDSKSTYTSLSFTIYKIEPDQDQ